MKYIIDLPDDYNGNWVTVDMPIDVKRSGTTYMRKRVLPEPCVQEQEAFKVGDRVMISDGKEAYVLIPDYSKNNCVLLIEDSACPQMIEKSKLEKIGNCSDEARRFIQLSAESCRACVGFPYCGRAEVWRNDEEVTK